MEALINTGTCIMQMPIYMCLLKITCLHNKTVLVTKMLAKSICLGVSNNRLINNYTDYVKLTLCNVIKTHSSVSAAKKTKEDARHTNVLFYWYRKFAKFSLLYFQNYFTDFYQIYIFSALHIHYFTYQI